MNVMEFYSLEFGRMRTMTDKNGEPFFCGKDVCDALGHKRAVSIPSSSVRSSKARSDSSIG